MDRAGLRAALANANVQAFLRVIREGESSQGDDAYTVMFGGRHFTGFADHPRQSNTVGRLTSTAAGAYQFLSKTWDALVRQYGFPDFSPASQDEAAVALIHGRRALQALMAGDLAGTLERCSWEWASLPPGRYGQSEMTAERVYATYDRWGGHYYPVGADAPPAAQNGPGAAIGVGLVSTTLPDSAEAPMAPFVAAALPMLIEQIPALVRLFGKGSRSEQNAQTAEKVVEIVKTATGSSTIEEAVGKITGDPAARDLATEAVESSFYELVEAGGGGLDGARAYNLKVAGDGGGFWRMPAFWITLTLLPLLYGTVFIVLMSTSTVFSGELRAAIASSVVTGILSSVLGFWLGSSFTTSKSRGLGATASQ